MNKRIKELAEQCWDRRLDGVHFNQEMFAELIVRECAQLVEDNMDPHNAWITPGYIKEHFGVE